MGASSVWRMAGGGKGYIGAHRAPLNAVMLHWRVLMRGGRTRKSSRIKTNSSFTLVQKRHLSFLYPYGCFFFSFLVFLLVFFFCCFCFVFFNKQACHTKGGGEVFFG